MARHDQVVHIRQLRSRPDPASRYKALAALARLKSGSLPSLGTKALRRSAMSAARSSALVCRWLDRQAFLRDQQHIGGMNPDHKTGKGFARMQGALHGRPGSPRRDRPGRHRRGNRHAAWRWPHRRGRWRPPAPPTAPFAPGIAQIIGLGVFGGQRHAGFVAGAHAHRRWRAPARPGPGFPPRAGAPPCARWSAR